MMAAIIAQMAVASRERKKRARNRTEIPSNKSTILIQPFNRNFDPAVHNKYIRQKLEREVRLNIMGKVSAKILAEEQLKREIIAARRWNKEMARFLSSRRLHQGEELQDLKDELRQRITAREESEGFLIEVMNAIVAFLFLVAFTAVAIFVLVVVLSLD